MSRQHGNESTHLAKAESSKGDYSKKGPGIWINCEFKWLCKLKDIMRSLVSKLFFFLNFYSFIPSSPSRRGQWKWLSSYRTWRCYISSSVSSPVNLWYCSKGAGELTSIQKLRLKPCLSFICLLWLAYKGHQNVKTYQLRVRLIKIHKYYSF